ncbi:MAG: dTDP-4-dehydrorhamnose reductase [Pseudomonadota bacterium]
MRILVTGAGGQLGQSLAAAKRPTELQLILLQRKDLDVTDPISIEKAFSSLKPDLVINCAAYTAVDQAESEPDFAFAINADGAGNVAKAAANVGSPIIHISTDYVFDGEKGSPYTEEDSPNPLNVYGASKLAGEREVAAANRLHIILRTSWLFGPFGSNFMKTMLRLAKTQKTIDVVSDQTGCPTSTTAFAAVTLALSSRIQTGKTENKWGIYHCSATKPTNWASFAAKIFDASEKAEVRTTKINKITSVSLGAPADRPLYSVLNCDKLRLYYDLSCDSKPRHLPPR